VNERVFSTPKKEIGDHAASTAISFMPASTGIDSMRSTRSQLSSPARQRLAFTNRKF